MANIVGYDDKLEFCEVEDNLSFLDDIPLDMQLPPWFNSYDALIKHI